MVALDIADPQFLALCVFGGFVGLSIILYAIASFGMREKSYEEALAEQRARLDKENQQLKEVKQQKRRHFAGRRKKEREKGGSPSVRRQEVIQEAIEEEQVSSEEELPPTPVEVTPRQEKARKKEKQPPVSKSQPRAEKKMIIEEEIQVTKMEKPLEAVPPPIVEESIQRVIEDPIMAQQTGGTQAAMPPAYSQEEVASPVKTKKGKQTGPAGDSADISLKGKGLVAAVRAASLKPNEIQQMIEILLNKQGGGSSEDWVKANQRNDPVSALKKQLQEKEQALHNEMLLVQSSQQKVKDLRAELAQEKTRSVGFESQYKNKVESQAQEIEALHRRMQQTHDGHSKETQALQARLTQVQTMLEGASVEHVKQLQEENTRLKSEASRVSQQKEQLMGNELARLQGEIQKLKSTLVANETLLRQSNETRRELEAQVTQYKQKMSQVESDQAQNSTSVSKRLMEVSEELRKSDAKKNSLVVELEKAKETLRNTTNDAEKVKGQILELQKSDEEKRNSLASLEEKLKDAEYQRQGLETKVRAAESQLKENDKIRTEKDQEIENLKLEKRSLESQLQAKEQRSEAEGEEAPDKGATINGEVVVKAAENTLLLKEHETLLSEKQKTIENLQQQYNTSLEEVQKLQADVEQQRKKNNGELEKLLAEEQQFSKATVQRIFPDIKIDQSLVHKDWLGQFEQKAAQHLKDQSSQSSESKAFESKISTLEADNKRLLSSISSLEDQNDELTRKLDEQEEEKEQLNSQCQHYQGVLGDTEGMLNKLQSCVELEEKKWQEKLTATEALLKQAKEEVMTLQKEVANLRTRQQEYDENEILGASSQEKLSQELATANTTIEQLRKDQQLAAQEFESTSRELDDLKKQLTVLKDELEAAKGDSGASDELKKIVTELENERSRLSKDLGDSKAAIAKLQKQLEASTASGEEVDKLKKELASTKEELVKLKSLSDQAESLKKQLEDSKKHVEGSAQEVQALKSNVQQSLVDKEKAAAALEEAQKELDGVKGQLQKLTEEQEEIKKSHSEKLNELESSKQGLQKVNVDLAKEKKLARDLGLAAGKLQQMLKKTQAEKAKLLEELGKPEAEVSSSLTDSQLEDEIAEAIQESMKAAAAASNGTTSTNANGTKPVVPETATSGGTSV